GEMEALALRVLGRVRRVRPRPSTSDTPNRRGGPRDRPVGVRAVRGRGVPVSSTTRLLDSVAPTDDLIERGLRRGQVGTVVELLDEDVFEVEFSDNDGRAYALLALRAELGLTYILISHDLAVVEHLATRVSVMYLGRIVETADTETLFNAPRHPYTQALLASVLTPDPSLGVPDAQLGAAYPDPVDPPSGCTFHPRCPRAMAHCATVAPRPVPTETGHVECHLYDVDQGRKRTAS
ncbi:MAG: DUF4926 domain-containing protein, partial [Proteobacteria bacterium]|nr:DUF4926 domain-containing protein [Pseudomonadota bacterium]